jgi:hypothetical protein
MKSCASSLLLTGIRESIFKGMDLPRVQQVVTFTSPARALCGVLVPSSILYATVISESRSSCAPTSLLLSVLYPLLNRAEFYGWVVISTCPCLEFREVEPIPGGTLMPAMCKMRPPHFCSATRYRVSEYENKNCHASLTDGNTFWETRR